MASGEKIIYVYENWSGVTPVLLGKLRSSIVRGTESFSFEYDASRLKEMGESILLDPDLALYQGRQYVPLDKQIFGMFADSCPDRWGRLLMNRREAYAARNENRKPRKLAESDYLLGVCDESRMGALRFSIEEGGVFLSDDAELAVPPWVKLRTLEHASIAFEKDEDGCGERWLKMLLAPGSSLGGARPKASVADTDGSLWIAKFPSKQDEYDIGAWEMVVHELAVLCGLNVPEAWIEKFSANGSTFLTKRFDRAGGRRIHFASAMTLLGKNDGASAQDVSSYLEMAEFIRSNGSAPKEDLIELWKRIVFNMAVSNTDDHLRNHGFILEKRGWRLAPAFDVNPVPYGDTLSLNVNEDDCAIDLSLALDAAGYFGMSNEAAKKTAGDICAAVGANWEKCAARYGIGRADVEYMRPAFELSKM